MVEHGFGKDESESPTSEGGDMGKEDTVGDDEARYLKKKYNGSLVKLCLEEGLTKEEIRDLKDGMKKTASTGRIPDNGEDETQD
jgi:hypothetical protein